MKMDRACCLWSSTEGKVDIYVVSSVLEDAGSFVITSVSV